MTYSLAVAKKGFRALTEADLEQARVRAKDAPPLPDEVRRQLVLLLKRQDLLPSDYRGLLAIRPNPSGWVLTHLIPTICNHLSAQLRKDNKPSSSLVATRLDQVGTLVLDDVRSALHQLVQPLPRGQGSKKAGEYQIAVLRILDLGILGFPVVSAIYAKTFGVLDTSTILLSESHLPVSATLTSAEKLDDSKIWELSNLDKTADVTNLLYQELILPDDFNPIPIG